MKKKPPGLAPYRVLSVRSFVDYILLISCAASCVGLSYMWLTYGPFWFTDFKWLEVVTVPIGLIIGVELAVSWLWAAASKEE